MTKKVDPVDAAQTYQMALKAISNAQTLHDARKRAIQALEFTFSAPEEGMLTVTSGYGYHTKEPFVTLGMANPQETANPSIQMRSDQARVIAFQILEAADSADSDGFIVEWLASVIELEERHAGQLLMEFRQWRAALRARRKEGEP